MFVTYPLWHGNCLIYLSKESYSKLMGGRGVKLMISPLANNYESMPQHEREKSRLLGVGIRRVHIGSILREGPGFICFFLGGGGV